MSRLEEALDVLKDVATGGPRQRAVALARGTRLLSELSSSEKRDLAVQVAEKAAPHLVPVIEAETGMDLSPQQISAVLQMARQLDEDQVEELRAALLDEDHRSDLATGVLSGLAADLGLEVPDDLSGLEPPPEADLELEDDTHLPGPPPPTAAPGPGQDADEHAEIHEPHELDLDPLPASELPEPAAEITFEPDPEPEPEGPTEPAARVAAVAAAVAPAPPTPVEDAPLEDAPAPVDPRPLVTSLRSATTTRARRSVLSETSTDDLWRMGAEGRRQVVAAFPDGWQRRRAVHRLLELDVVSADEAVALARTVEDTASRRWVVGSLAAAGLLDPEDLDGLVSAPTAERIGARRGG